MRVEEQFEIAAPNEEIYRQLNDVGGIGTCIAGVRNVTVESPDESRWEIIFRAGPMQRTVKLAAKILERDPPKRIVFSGTGQDVEISGHVDLDALGTAQTRCTVVIEANITGPLGPLVELMAKGPQQALIRETIGNLRARLEGSGVGEQAAAPQLPEPRRPGMLARWIEAFRRMFASGRPGGHRL